MGYDLRIEVDGRAIGVTIERDEFMGEPWKEHDGHGPVSDWTTRAKRPGERVIASDLDSRMYYDFAEAVRTARRDGWGHGGPYGGPDVDGETAGQKAVRAAEADFQYLRAWCQDEWYWTVVTAIVLDEHGRATEYRASVGGVESSDRAYVEDTAREIAHEAIAEAARWHVCPTCNGAGKIPRV